ncbi:MAG: two-component system, OmpR family, sensor kinase [Nocardioidaceae bacterium]|nr:two-component system, OmpR family, sensor kinase [Nocardioidaceae bacterium]
MRPHLGRAFASLTSRLVVTAVLLVAIVSLLVGTATTLAVRGQLLAQVDQKVKASVGRFADERAGPGDVGGDAPPPGLGMIGNQGPGTLVAFIDSQPDGYLLGDRRGNETALDGDALAALAGVPVDRKVHTVDVNGEGNYRVTAVDITLNGVDGVLVTGLPTADVDDSVRSLVLTEALLSILAVLAAGGIGTVVVRRQLRPLREVADTAHAVAALPLAEGDIDLTERVPEHLTDEHTEVGQVGSALNTLLAHVESSLEARHRSEQQVRQFVGDASHELRTPLATIAGYTELARRRPDDENVRTALGKIEEESVRMTSLVEDMLLLARLDAGRPLEREPVDLTRLLLEAVSDARVLAPDHHWRLDLPDAPLEVEGDEQRLHQVITNLLTNARKHTPAGTTVTVTGRPDGFDVHDDGPGFPADFVDHAFERFARVDQARERTGGAGLGLSLVEAIVRSHDGTVTLESASAGTTVAVRLR